MGSIAANTMVTANGVASRPEDWQFDYVSAPMMSVIGGSLQAAAGLVLGRRTYDEFAGYWPSVSAEVNPMAGSMNGLPKYVVSTTLTDPAWANTTVLPDLDAMKELKTSVAGELSIIGSPTLVGNLLEAELVDRLDLMVFPVVVPGGIRLLDNLQSRTALVLTHCAELPNGVVRLAYDSSATTEGAQR